MKELSRASKQVHNLPHGVVCNWTRLIPQQSFVLFKFQSIMLCIWLNKDMNLSIPVASIICTQHVQVLFSKGLRNKSTYISHAFTMIKIFTTLKHNKISTYKSGSSQRDCLQFLLQTWNRSTHKYFKHFSQERQPSNNEAWIFTCT